MRKSITALLGLSLIGLSAIADEVWSTPIGDVVYEDETDDGWAVWSYPGLTERGTVYIKDLAGVYEGRTAYAGIWIEAESPGIELCDVAVTDPATGPRGHRVHGARLSWRLGRTSRELFQ